MQNLTEIASQVRRDIVRMVHGVQSGHPGGSLGCTDFLVNLYFSEMNHNPDFDMDGKGQDLFFLVKWAYFTALFYSVLGT
jgi:transketolase